MAANPGMSKSGTVMDEIMAGLSNSLEGPLVNSPYQRQEPFWYNPTRGNNIYNNAPAELPGYGNGASNLKQEYPFPYGDGSFPETGTGGPLYNMHSSLLGDRNNASALSPPQQSFPFHLQQPQHRHPHHQLQFHHTQHQQVEQPSFTSMFPSSGDNPSNDKPTSTTPDLLSKRAAVIASMARRPNSLAPEGTKSQASSNAAGATAGRLALDTSIGTHNGLGDTSQSTADNNDITSPESRQEKTGPQPRATTADIDGLVAEGKAAAAGASSLGTVSAAGTASNGRVSSNDVAAPRGPTQSGETPKKEQRQQPRTDRDYSNIVDRQIREAVHINKSGLPQVGSGSGAEALVHNTPETFHDAGDESHSQTQRRPGRSVSKVIPERHLYELPKRSAIVDGLSLTSSRGPNTNPEKRHGGKPTVPVEPPKDPPREYRQADVDHEFMHLNPEELGELREWLVLTGYSDENYRRKTIHRHKRLAELEKERSQLMREMEEERGVVARRPDPARAALLLPFQRSENSQTSITPNITRSAGPPATSANAVSVAPLPTSQAKQVSSVTSSAVDRRRDEAPASERPTSDTIAMDMSSARKTLKRGYPSIPSRDMEHGRLKMPRVESMGHDDENSDDGETSKRGPPASPSRSQRSGFHSRANTFGSSRGRGVSIGRERLEDGDVSPEYRYNRDPSTFARSRGRGGRGSGFSPRGGMRGSARFTPTQLVHRPPGHGDLHLDSHNTRFFLIKSIDYDFVESSQREGIWVTQLKNTGKIIDAFKTCENVMLVFSVNQSKAFQGYALMEALPDASIAHPSWLARLHWETSPPFRVRWINKNETSFRGLAHLTNSYNEDSAVFFGRDGQEIEPQCGLGLCILLDESLKSPY